MSSHSSELQAIITKYFDLQEQGRPPDPESFITAHPQHANVLRELLDAERIVGAACSPLREQQEVPDKSFYESLCGSVLGGYELKEILGHGGMGVVYRARHEREGRDVALKLIRQHLLTHPSHVARFETEMRCLERLKHRHIIPLYCHGVDDGKWFCVMQLTDGGSLTELAYESPRSEVSRLVTIVEGLRSAHQAGVIHCDLKPSNILLDAEGNAFISDFGLASDDAHDSVSDMTPTRGGTFRYMAPEQFLPNSLPSIPSDIYSIGALLFDRIVGRPLFESDTPDLIESIRAGVTPQQLALVSSKSDLDLQAIIGKCVAFESAERYQHCDELQQDLRCWLDGRNVTARPVPIWVSWWRWCRRNRLAASLAAATILSILIGTALTARYARIARREADDNAVLATRNIELAKTAIHEAAIARAAEQKATQRQEQVQEQLKLLSSIFTNLNPEVDSYDDQTLRNRLTHNLRQAAHTMRRFTSLADPADVELALSCANILSDIGLQSDSLALLKETRTRVARQLGEQAKPVLALDVMIGRTMRLHGDDVAGLQQIESCVGQLVNTLPESDETRLRAEITLAEALMGIPSRCEDALQRFQSLADRTDPSKHSDTTSSATKTIRLTALHGIGGSLHGMRKLPEARTALETALRVSDQSYGTEHVNSIRLHQHLGNVLRDLGDFRKSREHLEQAFEKGSTLLGDDNGETISALNMLMVTCAMKADDRDMLDRLNELLPLVEASCETMSRISGDCNPTVLLMIDNYAAAVGVTGNVAKSVSIRRDVIARHERTFGRNDIRTQRMVRNLALVLKESNHPDETRELLQEYIGFATEHPDSTKKEINDAKRILLELDVGDFLAPANILKQLMPEASRGVR